MQWWPNGFSQWESDPDVAWQWSEPADCSTVATSCWGLTVAVNRDCSSLYGEISIAQGNTVVDFSNDTLEGIAASQTGSLNFEWYSDNDAATTATATLTQLDCL